MNTTKATAIRNFNENQLYNDSASVYRYTKVKNPDNSTTQKLKNIPELSALPCLLNIEKPDSAEAEGEINSLNAVYSMFISDLESIKSGDYIKVMSKRKEYKFIAGDPVVYDCHQEVPLSLKEWA